MHKKGPKIGTCCRVGEAKFYLYQSTKKAKARPGFDDQPEYPSVQINSSSPCLSLMCPRASGRLSNVQSSRAWPLNMGGLVALAIMFF